MKRRFALFTLAMVIFSGGFYFGCSKKNPTQPAPTLPAHPTVTTTAASSIT